MSDAREIARALGLCRLTDNQLVELMRAFKTIGEHLQRLPRDLPPAQEMALIFRAKGS
jgi:hypothetical protein